MSKRVYSDSDLFYPDTKFLRRDDDTGPCHLIDACTPDARSWIWKMLPLEQRVRLGRTCKSLYNEGEAYTTLCHFLKLSELTPIFAEPEFRPAHRSTLQTLVTTVDWLINAIQTDPVISCPLAVIGWTWHFERPPIAYTRPRSSWTRLGNIGFPEVVIKETTFRISLQVAHFRGGRTFGIGWSTNGGVYIFRVAAYDRPYYYSLDTLGEAPDTLPLLMTYQLARFKAWFCSAHFPRSDRSDIVLDIGLE